MKGGFFTIPYSKKLSDIIFKFCRKTNNIVTITYKTFNKLNKFIKIHKDSIEFDHKTNLVYQINCNSCKVFYVGQTKRKLKTRIKEHRNQINHNSNNISVVTEHRLQTSHDFD